MIRNASPILSVVQGSESVCASPLLFVFPLVHLGQVLPEVHGHLAHLPEVLPLQHGDLAFLLLHLGLGEEPLLGQGHGGLEGFEQSCVSLVARAYWNGMKSWVTTSPGNLTVSNSSPAPFHPCYLFVLQHVASCRVRNLYRRTPLLFELVEELVPDLGSVLVVEALVVDDDVDARDDGVVELSYPVAGEEENALVVFDLSEEDCYDCTTPGAG